MKRDRHEHEARRGRRPEPCACSACAGRCAAPVQREPVRDCREERTGRSRRRDRPR